MMASGLLGLPFVDLCKKFKFVGEGLGDGIE